MQLDLLQEAHRLRAEGMATVSSHTAQWERDAIDDVIRTVAARGKPFTANDCRPLLPWGIKGNKVSARFGAWSKSGLIVKTGRFVTSTDPGTHGAMVREWLGAAFVEAGAA